MTTYYVDGVDGADINAGTAEGSGNAWATVDKAMNTVAAGDIVYVKNNATYSELATIDTVGTITAPVLFIGYGTTASRTDRGKATIDGGSARANCIADSLASVGGYYVFENFIFSNATALGVNLSLNQMVFRNCEFNSNGTGGLSMGNGLMAESCSFVSNGGHGVDAGTVNSIFGCWFESNTSDGVRMTYGTVVDCIFYDTGANAIDFLGSNGFPCVAYGCTIDGNAKNTAVGISFPASFWGPYAAINCIIYDCTTGITGHNNGGGRFIGRNNLLNNNTTDYNNTGYETLVGEVTSAPAFTAEASQDYTLSGSSPCLNAGFDAYEVQGSTQKGDIGALESSTSGAGSGAPSPNKRGGKQ